jgi:hypothetical protein
VEVSASTTGDGTDEDGNYIAFLELASSEDSDAIWIVEIEGTNRLS